MPNTRWDITLLEYKGAAKVSIVMIGQQAIMDSYLCLLHLTAGILVGTYVYIYISMKPFHAFLSHPVR